MILICYYLFINKINLNKILNLRKYFYTTILISFLIVVSKNLIRVFNSDYSIIPEIKNLNITNNIVKNYDKNNNFSHYSTKKDYCGYFLSPCSNNSYKVLVNKNLNYKIIKIDD